MMRVRRSPDARSFLAEAGPFLAEREAEHNLLFGICSSLLRDPEPFGQGPAYLAIVEDDGHVIGTAIRTPPHNVVLSETDHLAGIEPLALDVLDAIGTLPGVVGPRPAASVFARAWCERAGGTATLRMANRIYRATQRRHRRAGSRARCDRTAPPIMTSRSAGSTRSSRRRCRTRRWTIPRTTCSGAASRIRTATSASGKSTAIPSRSPAMARARRTASGSARCTRPRACAGTGTRARWSGRMTAELLDGPHRYCFLFTDLANPTSNGIYQRIGYEAVSDVDQYAFV